MTYISFVVWYKHFDYPSSSMKRLHMFVENIRDYSEKYGLDFEVSVCQMPPYQRKSDFPDVRLCDFPLKAHLTNWALNMAIRNSTGEFILSTNRDIIFNEAVIKCLSSKPLEKGKVYRVTRYNTPSAEPYPETLVELRKHCEGNVLNVQTPNKGLIFWPELLEKIIALPRRYPFTNGCGDFLLMHRDHWFDLRGFAELVGMAEHGDSMVMLNAIYSGIRQVIMKDPLRVYHVDHPRPKYYPVPAYAVLFRYIMLLRKPVILNGENWGTGLQSSPSST